MKNSTVRGLVSVAALATLAGTSFGQFTQSAAAPTSAQRWETGFMIERFAPDGTTLLSTNFMSNIASLNQPIAYATNVSVGRVDITYMGRVGILANSAGTVNLGISRLGGAGSATSGGRITFVDAISQGAGLNQGTVARAGTGDGTAAGGVPNTGMFKPFRGAFAGFSPASNGANTDASNGALSNTATGAPVAFNFTGGRTVNFGAAGEVPDNFNGSGGPAGEATIDGTTLSGDFVGYYKLSYFPREDFSANPFRLINGSAAGQTGRYIFNYNGAGQASNGASFNIPVTNFAFAVPTPGAAALVGLAGVAVLRRRRQA
ncbi:MAG: hypothetical protein ACKVS8_05835 [Phycisphaerales bacterium]